MLVVGYDILDEEGIVSPKERFEHTARTEPNVPNFFIKENSMKVCFNLNFASSTKKGVYNILLI